jgi:hypothetical protein
LLETLEFSKSNPIIIQDNIVVNYSQNLEQFISINAKIYGPILNLSSSLIDFGSTLVEQERCQQIVLKNRSHSSVLWELRIEDDRHSVFRTEINDGFLQANKNYFNKDEQIINVFFKAK